MHRTVSLRQLSFLLFLVLFRYFSVVAAWGKYKYKYKYKYKIYIARLTQCPSGALTKCQNARWNKRVFNRFLDLLVSVVSLMLSGKDFQATEAPFTEITQCSKNMRLRLRRSYLELELSVCNNFSTLITESIGHRQVLLFSHLTYFTHLLYLGKLSRPKYL